MDPMSTMIVQHTVKDFGQWKTQYDAMFDLRKNFGCTGEEVYKGNGNQNAVVIFTHWGSKDQAAKYGQSQELKDGMAKAGVVSAPHIYFVD